MRPIKILTSKQICEFLQITTKTLYSERWRKLNGIPVFFKDGYIFAYEDLFYKWYREQRALAYGDLI